MRAIAWRCGGLRLACGSSHVSGGTGSSAGQRVLHLHFSGGGSGQVRSATPGFTCSAGCDQSIAAGATVHIDAVPAGGSRFDGWSGACSGTGGCDVAMDADHDVTAAFSTLPPPPPSSSRLTVVMIGKGSGRVTSSPAGIDCTSPATCLLTVATGSSVSLSESADANSTFIGWGGGCSGAGGCNVTVTGETVVWANFDAKGPPPPPPASCAGLTPATGLASVMHSIPRSAAGGAVCFPGIGDSTGTLGLITRGGDSIGTARTRTFYFVEETGGREKTSMAFLGSSGAYEVYTQQPDGFLVVFFVPSGPESFSIVHFDHDGRIGSNGARDPMMGKPAIKESPLGGILLSGDFTIRNDTTPVTLLQDRKS